MLRGAFLSPQRRVMVYLGAVVGPTLVVLTLGALAGLRQMEALDALRLTTERLQEARMAAEIEQSIRARASAALADPVLDRLASASAAADPASLDDVRRGLSAFGVRHPVAQSAFVVGSRELQYPRTDAFLPLTIDQVIAEEPPQLRGRLERALDVAKAHESKASFEQAATAYADIERVATTRWLKGIAAASVARVKEQIGHTVDAPAAYQRLYDLFGDTYSLARRPHALLAAHGLVRLGRGADPRVAAARQNLVAGRWSLTSEQADYFLQVLAQDRNGTSDSSPFLDELATARTLLVHVRPAAEVTPGQTMMAAVVDGDRRLQVAYRAAAMPQDVVGIVIDLEWIKGSLLPEVVNAVTPGQHVELGPLSSEHTGFSTMLPGWRVGIVPPATRRPSWLRADFIAFAGTILVVLGVLVMGVLLLMRDVQRETTVNRLRADLVGGISHELKTPLSVIRLYAETIDGAADAEASDRHRFAEAIVQETERLRRLVDGVIDFSKIQQGERTYTMRPGSLVSVVATAVGRFRDYLALHGFTLTATLPPALPDMTFDPLAVDQAVMNLLDNAFKYSGESTELAVRLARRRDAVEIEVQDHGVGIDAGDRARIFDRFHRGAHADRGGYGLGLYLVQHIMDAHGGCVEVESAPGKGSVFRLVFPMSTASGVTIQDSPILDAGRSPEVSHAESHAHRG